MDPIILIKLDQIISYLESSRLHMKKQNLLLERQLEIQENRLKLHKSFVILKENQVKKQDMILELEREQILRSDRLLKFQEELKNLKF